MFELIAGHPALDLVNTVDWRFREGEAKDLLSGYEDLLAFGEQSGVLSKSVATALREANPKSAAGALRSAKELRELCADACYSFIDGRRLKAETISGLERYFRVARTKQQLTAGLKTLAWGWAGMERTPELPVWLLAIRAEALLTSNEEFQNVHACGEPECRWLFLDHSKNHTRRWCDMKICGNRVKARRFKAQHQG